MSGSTDSGVSDDFMSDREQPADAQPRKTVMLRYLLDTNVVIYAIKNRPQSLRQKFNRVARFRWRFPP